MAQPPLTGRNVYPGRVPDRTLPSSSQPQFGQSAPNFARQVQFPQQPPPPPQQGAYGSHSQYAPSGAYGATRGHTQGPIGGVNTGTERESNALNDLSQEQRDEIDEAFAIFDLDRNNFLDLHEFRVGLRALGFQPDNGDLLQLMVANGTPKPNSQPINDGRRGQSGYHATQLWISRENFARVASQMMMERDPNDEVERAFKLFDMDSKGYISIEDLRRVTRELGETSLEEQELQTMIEEFDYEGIGGVSRQAFFGICLQ